MRLNPSRVTIINNDMKHKEKKSGVVFFTTLVLLTVAVFICAAVTLMVMRDGYTVRRVASVNQAYFLAEAGIEEAIMQLNANWTWAGNARNLGAGNYTTNVTVNVGDSTRKLITSTATINTPTGQVVTRVIKAQVQTSVPPSFDYALLSGDKQLLNGSALINGAAGAHTAKVQSNSNTGANDIWLWFWAPWVTPPTINGSASACGQVNNVNGSINPGPSTNNAPAVQLPPFDNNFYNWYQAHADRSYAGNQTFGSIGAEINPWATAGVHVVYVNGNVTFDGNMNFQGCLIATGDITFPSDIVFIIIPITHYVFTQNLYTDGTGNVYPAFISRNGTISNGMSSDVNINGMVYAGNKCLLYENLFSFGHINVNGAVYASDEARLRECTITYVRPNPPGLTNPAGITVLSWTVS